MKHRIHGWMMGVVACAGLALLPGCGAKSGEAEDETGTNDTENPAQTLGTNMPSGAQGAANTPGGSGDRAPRTLAEGEMEGERFGPFVVTVRRAPGAIEGSFVPHTISVRAGDAQVWNFSADALIGVAGHGKFKGATEGIRQGADLTGNGQPNLILTEFSGGANCCTTFHLLELTTDRAIRALDVIDAKHAGRFVDLDGNGTAEFEGHDWTFAYWKTSYADSPRPRIVLRWSGGGYVLAPDLMRIPRPTGEEIDQIVTRILNNPGWAAGEGPNADPSAQPPSDLWHEALRLIYGGHPQLGMRVLRMGWPANRDGFDAFRTEFESKLRDESLYGAIMLAGD